jgi:hypothetical protein
MEKQTRRKSIRVYSLFGIVVICVLVCVFFFSVVPVSASVTSGIATYLSLQDNAVHDGDIVSFSPQGYLVSKKPYDPYLFGVVVQHPAVSLLTTASSHTYPVTTSGTVYVRVSTGNGTIAKGDLITSSSVPGVGMKAVKSGYVIGSALESFDAPSSQKVGTIAVALDIHYFTTNGSLGASLTDILNLSKIATYEAPSTVVRYLIAGVIVLISFGAGFFIFEKTVVKSIDAIGRNPLASHIVQLGMVVNILITLGITCGGLFIAYVVLRL